MEKNRNYIALLETIRDRRSIRRFEQTPVSEPLLQQILEAARWAPSAGNRQALRFLVVRDRATIEALAQGVREATAELGSQLRDGLAADTVAYMKSFEHFSGAPVLVVPIYRQGVDLLRAGQRPEGGESPPAARELDAISSVSAATMNLLLAAHALGLGACWMTGPLVAEASLAQTLGVPQGWRVAALIPVGYPAETPEAPRRRPLASLVRHLD
jgi:nitroreductase